ncbi:MAG TPA: NAD(P)H-dependent oxidoreductase [Bacteroidota bacterium]|nr:NAD(P)H-dependent oxidoreductase [Bacteroidota bacterium]
MDNIRILAICGSLRKNSLNRKALYNAIKIANKLKADVKEFDLRLNPLPLFNEDLKIEDIENVQILKKEIESSDIIMISSPEYNHSVPGVLKNLIDWGSKNPNSFSGKRAIIFGVSAGVYGTIRMQIHLRQILNALNVYIEPLPQIHIGNGEKIFDTDGNILDSKIVEQLQNLIEKTIKNLNKN